MEFLRRFCSSFLTGKGRSSIAVFLAVALMFGLFGPPPAKAQIGAIAVTAAAAAVVAIITNTIGALLGTSNGLLSDINRFFQALASLWQQVVYPIALINQARLMVTQLIAQFRGSGYCDRQHQRPERHAAQSDCAGGNHAERIGRGLRPIRSGVPDDIPAIACGGEHQSW